VALTRNHALVFLGVCAAAALPIYGYLASRPSPSRRVAPTTADAIVVGAGIAGLSAAYELAKGGADVIVVDTASVFGGHAVMATGDLSIAGTPFQEAAGLHDSVELFLKDMQAWGEDPDPYWSRFYVEHARNR
jgi:succinate dehydrogenase/fumarate reductase flavoprotein subunit